MKLLGKEVDSEVAVLASLSRSRYTDDLARAALEDQEITDANVVTWDSNSIGSSTTIDVAHALTDTFSNASWSPICLVNDHLLTLGTMAMRMERVKDTVGGFFKTVAE